MHVLIGTDGSDDALEAASRALGLLAHADTVTVLAVGETPAAATAGFESGFAGGVASPDEVDAAWKAVEGATNDAVDVTSQAITGLDPASTIQRRVEVGDPGQTICRIAGELGVDAVIVGSRGRGALKRALLGSVSSYVVHNAPCPVLVIRADA
jgi:nucleotide-binding universal stress UspA family protein